MKKSAPIKAVTEIPSLACFGAAIAFIKTDAKIIKNERIIPAWLAVTPRDGAIAANHVSHTILIDNKKGGLL